eukprot:scaffold22243_cov96-Isochrysis_galbana.AAC.1
MDRQNARGARPPKLALLITMCGDGAGWTRQRRLNPPPGAEHPAPPSTGPAPQLATLLSKVSGGWESFRGRRLIYVSNY